MNGCTLHLRPEITVDPGRLGGTPTLGGHRLYVDAICSDVWTHGVEAPIESMLISRAEVLTCCWYAGIYGVVDKPVASQRLPRSPWRERWGTWASTWDEAMWGGRYHFVPDPPCMGAA